MYSTSLKSCLTAPIKWLMDFLVSLCMGDILLRKKNVPGFVGVFYGYLKKNDETIQCMVDIKILSHNS